MVKISGLYIGDKKCETTHDESGYKIQTDPPKDNQGNGERFSPTDLMAVSLATCMVTSMALVTERDGHNFRKSRFTAAKEMHSNPRRVARLTVDIYLDKDTPIDYRSKLQAAAMSCPVKRSLHPDIEVPVAFHYTES